MKIHGTAKGGAISNNDFGVAFGGNGGNGGKAKIVWDLPLNNATQSEGILTRSGAASCSANTSWTLCCNASGDAEKYDSGEDYTFHYTGDVEDGCKNVQIGLHTADITANNQISFGFVITDVVYKILDGTTSELETSPVASDTWSLTINADGSGSWNKNDEAVATWSAGEFDGTYWHNATMYYQATYASATVE